MKAITKLDVTRTQLAEPHFYYNGCESDTPSIADEQISETVIVELAADVLLNILLNNYSK